MSNYLLAISIGPVQEFIASARRSRDLWYGSWLLSELSKAVARRIAAQSGLAALIFPAPATLADLRAEGPLNVSNKLLAQVGSLDAAQTLKDVLQDELLALWAVAQREHIRGSLNSDDYALAQILDLPELYWVAVEIAAGADGYRNARNEAERLLAARKLTRDFAPVSWGSALPKSSLDGARESVIPEDAYPKSELRESTAERKLKIESLFSNYGAGRAEQLSGVDLLKRNGARGAQSRFASTSHIAARPLMKRLDTAGADVRAAWDKYIAAIPASALKAEHVEHRYGGHPIFGDYDGSLLFESRLPDLGLTDDAEVTRVGQALTRFFDVAAAPRPGPYYALLVADGDRMGAAIDRQGTAEQHRSLSQALGLYAASVKAVVEGEYEGALVYAGGDDVLAFVPLHTALACAQKLAENFRIAMHEFGPQPEHAPPGAALPDEAPTMSVGMVIAHHIEPLSDALELARRAEHAAKDAFPTKNALAVTLSKRSGADLTVVGHWGELDRRLGFFVELHRQEQIPDGAAYELRDLAVRLGEDGEQKLSADMREIMRLEAIRILSRKRANRGEHGVSAEVLAQLKELVAGANFSAGRLAGELIVAREFARAAELADPKRSAPNAAVVN